MRGVRHMGRGCRVAWIVRRRVGARPNERYGPGRRIGKDRILSDIRKLWDGVKISVPVIPIHLFVQGGHHNIQVLDVRPHHLSRRGQSIIKALFPLGESFLFNGFPG